ncbi:uncharacterized protein LOC134247577 [Saccostrea cucullata]|uniref:uncharacterized protein LOC134247577 n=1 Tax=Saccostrea cuccullata TaxID=36930 RepID=UPI002ED18064
MQPRQKSHSIDEGGRPTATNWKRKFAGKARLPGVKKRCQRVKNSEPPQYTDPGTNKEAMPDLEEVVSSVAEKMLPEINKRIETIISQHLDTPSTEGSKVSSSTSTDNVQNLSNSDQVICFDTFSPSCSMPQSITSVNDYLGMHVTPSVKQKIMKGEFVELHTLLNKQTDIEALESRVLFSNGQLTLKPANTIKITTIDTWLDAFFIYMSIYLSAHIDQTHSLIIYMANVKLGASRVSGGLEWKEYDRQFRLKRAKDNSISWDKIDPEL